MTAGKDRETLIAVLEERQDEQSFEEAKRFLDAELAGGEDARLLLDYGYIHECRGRAAIRDAIRWYERSLELDPAAERTRHQLIAAHAALGQTHEAIELYKRRLAAAPEEVIEYRCLGHAYLAAGEVEEATAVIEGGLALSPDDTHLLDQLGSVLAGRGRTEEALATWRRVLELDGEYVDVRYNRAFLLERLGRTAEAVAEWEAIVAWLRERGFEIEAQWPERELARLRRRIGGSA